MKKFIKKNVLFLIPIILLFSIPVGTFYFLDPFRILNDYEKFTNSIVSYNEDYVATERYLRNKNKYNSFILGSSRAGCGFQAYDWKKKLDIADKAFSFTASNESIFGIWGKMRLLDKENTQIKNVLLVIDTDVTMKKIINSEGHIYIKHPKVSGESENSFIQEYLKDYIFSGFFIRYLDYKIFKVNRSYMSGYLDINNQNSEDVYIPFNVQKLEDRILSDVDNYYNKIMENQFYKRPINQEILGSKIDSKCIVFLKEIKSVFVKHKTNYKIVISPLYDQKKINKSDLNIIREIFGEENVFDYSGKNKYTSDKRNYYETSHYRMKVGRQIIETIYFN